MCGLKRGLFISWQGILPVLVLLLPMRLNAQYTATSLDSLYGRSILLAELQPDSALLLAQEVCFQSKLLKLDSLTMKGHGAQGLAFEYMTQLDSALKHYNLAIAIAERLGDGEGVASNIASKGIACFYQDDYGRAIQFYDQALRRYEADKNLKGQAKVLNNLGIVYRTRLEYAKAIETYQRSIEIKSRLQDTLGLGYSYMNVGRAYYHLDSTAQSLENYQKALFYLSFTDDYLSISEIKAGLGTSYLDAGDVNQARVLFEESYAELEGTRSLSLFLAVIGLAQISVFDGNYQRAVDLFEKHQSELATWGNDNARRSILKPLSEAYAELGDYEPAYLNLLEFANLAQAAASDERQRLAEEMQVRFETREKEDKILLQDLELAEGQRRFQLLISLSALVLLLLGGAVALVFIRTRSNQRLRAQKVLTEAALADRETLLREIHHRVKNNLQVVSSLLSIQGREIEDDQARRAVNESRNRVHSMALIHQFLYGEEHLNTIDMIDYVEQLSKSLLSTYQVDQSQISIQNEIQAMRLDVDTAIPVGLILNELITNALKYAFPEGRAGVIKLRLFEAQNQLVLQVADNGVGANANDVKPKSSSFGMKLLNAFKAKLQADFDIENQNGLIITYRMSKYLKS
jgi:two-component sensor histidine kinase/Tfp pilus assembly protein PilF